MPTQVPRRVFWVRRLVVLGVPLLLVGLVVWVLAGRGSDAAAQTAPTPKAGVTSGAPVPDATTAPTKADEQLQDDLDELSRKAAVSGVVVCDAASLQVDATATAGSFAGSTKPTFTIAVTNRGDEACLVDAGDEFRTVLVTSGKDRVWSSTDCLGDDPTSRPLLLGPGDTSKETYTWPRVRSAEDCRGGLKAPGRGTYSAQVVVVGVPAAPAVFDLG
ncbi:hypothetical protein [Cellulomonas composti]|uniref:DUF4232 domain-containing protein n=1 Tax=Cellulomonas composti TaxID=266130 RepID=A0A511JBF3_9CELL|nr:hypothetical protein [Cellulomonas composti]GEL95320.1 hypothetical protein CCO02nite_19780 [Cellulomonas composti]